MYPASKRLAALGVAVFALGFFLAFQACESPESFHLVEPPVNNGTGGETPGAGGVLGSGGGAASGGISGSGTGGRGTGGAMAAGGRGVTGSGGSGAGGRGVASGSGGASGTGGAGATGGADATGGRSAGGGGRAAASGGASASGGAPGSGGIGAGGGRSGSVGGGPGRGGGPGSGGRGSGGQAMGGRSGVGGSGSDSCVSAVQAGPYAFPPADPCSACMDHATSREMQCKAGIDCLASKWPCDSNCKLGCLNMAGDTVIQTCVRDLVNASCGAGSL